MKNERTYAFDPDIIEEANRITLMILYSESIEKQVCIDIFDEMELAGVVLTLHPDAKRSGSVRRLAAKIESRRR